MKAISTLTLFLLIFSSGYAQNASIKGQLQDTENAAVEFANAALYLAADTSLVKVETSNESGIFHLQGLSAGEYFLVASFVGMPDLRKTGINLTADQQLDLGTLSFSPSSVELNEVTVTASRAMVEVKADRMVFNVQGTINSVGADAISLLRKAPGVTVDNNDNINVLGRSGVLLYVDGKRLPITGEDLSAYLQNLPAEQIDRIDIISNPGARYEAEGNAGIIDIRLVKDKSHGMNGAINATYSQGELPRYNLGASANYRNKKMNVFGSLGHGRNESFNDMVFESFQNSLFLDETNRIDNQRSFNNFRIGTDFFVSKNHTLGFLVSGNYADGDNQSDNRIRITTDDAPMQTDSFLVAAAIAESNRNQSTFNLNYRFDGGKDRSVNIDLDYGTYRNDAARTLPNRYYLTTAQETLLTEIISDFETPTDIDIYTFKVDYEDKLWGGKVGIGSKLSRVVSDNTFRVFDVEGSSRTQNDRQSNIFDYDENVYAGYLTYARPINQKWNFSAGLRAEQTDATGDLQAFLPELQEEPVDLNYLSWFPSAGLTWQVARMHSLALNYGRRINRPDYNVLNPFNNQLSELSSQKGNPRLNPEIVNNIELGYTLQYRYNFKIGYSRTTDQITRLIAPDDEDPRAGFITWANLAEQTVISLNISAPMQINKWWSAYFNLSASHLDNQADYGEGAVVDVQAYTYSIYQQHTFNLPKGFKGEISGYFAGPGVWGGVFRYETSYSLDLGLQKKFLQDRLNLRLSASDLFYQTGWDGYSLFDGLRSVGSGRWDSRRVSLSASYRFGNQNVKSRKRKTGIEDEAKRVGSN